MAHPRPGVGPLLRTWRHRRHLSQSALAYSSGLSPRHLSFVETGRSRPSPEVILHLAEHLEVPLRERNGLLLAAGYAPRYRETPLDAPAMRAVRETLDRLLAGHDPYPAIVVDGHWNLLAANASASLFTALVDPELLEPPANAFRLSLHPRGLAPHILNLASFAGHQVQRLRRQHAQSGDPVLAELLAEVSGYPGIDQAASEAPPDPAEDVVLLVRLASSHGELTLLSTVATFGAPHDITTSELAIESFFPADEATAALLRSRGVEAGATGAAASDGAGSAAAPSAPPGPPSPVPEPRPEELPCPTAPILS